MHGEIEDRNLVHVLLVYSVLCPSLSQLSYLQYNCFTVDIWAASSHDDEVGTLGCLIFVLVILEPSSPVRNFFPRVVMIMATFSESLHTMLHLGNVGVVIYFSNKYIP